MTDGVERAKPGRARRRTPAPAATATTWIRVLGGMAAIVAGILAIVWPDRTVLVLTRLFGLAVALWGIVQVASSLRRPDRRYRTLLLIGGGGTIVGGLVILSWPGPTVTVLATLAAIAAIAWGVLDLATVVLRRRADLPSWLPLARGVVSIGLGTALLTWPDRTIVVVSVLLGIQVILWGAAALLEVYLLTRVRDATAGTTH
jgi:uncharacterized membrane protein HdeD (DUF308 family)